MEKGYDIAPGNIYTNVEFDFTEFDAKFKDFVAKLKETKPDPHKKSYEELTKLMEEKENSFSDLLTKAANDYKRLGEFNHEQIIKDLEALRDDTKKNQPDENPDEDEYMSPPLEDGNKVFSYKDNIIFHGKFENDFYKEGTLIRQDPDKERTVYKGHFSNENNIETFNGIYLAPRKPNALYAIIGKSTKEEADGLLCYTDENGNLGKCFYGKFKGGKPEGDHILINSTQDHIKLTLVEGESSIDYNWKLKEYLVTIHKDDIESLYYKQEAELIYKGKLHKAEDKYEFNGEGTIIYNNNFFYNGLFEKNVRHGKGESYVLGSNDTYYIIRGEFDNDNVKDAKITKHIKDQEPIVVFKGVITGNIYNGEYIYSEKERFEGEIKDWQKVKGVYFYEDDSRFEGEWENDKKKKGTLIDKEGNKHPFGDEAKDTEIENNKIEDNETKDNEIENNKVKENETKDNEPENNEIKDNETENNETAVTE
jgi:hypothetical protein